jgi:hypothetical protein
MIPKGAPKLRCHPREDRLYIYCYKGVELFSPEAVSKLWGSVHAQIHSSTESFVLLRGNSSAQVVQEKHRMSDRWLVLPSWPWHENSVTLSPFGETCFGVTFTVSRAEYYIHTTIRGSLIAEAHTHTVMQRDRRTDTDTDTHTDKLMS